LGFAQKKGVWNPTSCAKTVQSAQGEGSRHLFWAKPLLGNADYTRPTKGRQDCTAPLSPGKKPSPEDINMRQDSPNDTVPCMQEKFPACRKSWLEQSP
jgi:hypothetical protein